jgi:hypothetical protein
MEAGVTDCLWSMLDIVELIESRESLRTGEWFADVAESQ